jgi:hypothetical protein
MTRYNIWENEDGTEVTMLGAGPLPGWFAEEKRTQALRIVHTFEAETWGEARERYNEFMGTPLPGKRCGWCEGSGFTPTGILCRTCEGTGRVQHGK